MTKMTKNHLKNRCFFAKSQKVSRFKDSRRSLTSSQLSLARQDPAGSVAGWLLGESKQSSEGRVTALYAGVLVQFRFAQRELGCLWSESNKVHFIIIIIDVKQTQQQRPESPTVIASQLAHKYKVHETKDVHLVKFMYLVFTRMPGENHRRRLRSLLLCLCNDFRALINSVVCWHQPNKVKIMINKNNGTEWNKILQS